MDFEKAWPQISQYKVCSLLADVLDSHRDGLVVDEIRVLVVNGLVGEAKLHLCHELRVM